MDFHILGPLEVLDRGRPIAIRGSTQRALLALFLLHPNETLTTERLIDELWSDRASATAEETVHVDVSRLREALAVGNRGGGVVAREGGYELRLDESDSLDAHRFERLVDEGRNELAAGRPERAASTLAEALALWRGDPLAELGSEPFAKRAVARLEHLRVGATEQLVEARLAAESARPSRRLVSVVFADMAGSTGIAERLDPESTHVVLDRFTDVCSGVIERHGGSVEGFIGDAVVGVFGQTELHEDDALRAVRAAVELRDEGAALSAELEAAKGVSIAMKLGVESGQVFVSPGARRSPFAAGDAFNVAARLEGAAREGEILLGDNTYCMVRQAVRAECLGPMEVKGRAAKVQVWRLLELEDGLTAGRPAGSRFVGREREVGELQAAFERACAERACRAVTVVGPAGIGKTRLAREFAAGLGDEATVVVGRCLSYGEDAAYRPLADIVRQLGDGDPRNVVDDLLDADTTIAQLVLAAIGQSDGPAQAEETFLAIRRLLEQAARERPLVVAVEDLHWAEPTLLDLLEYLVAFSGEHPMLLVCSARPEVLEMRPAWGVPQRDRSLLFLEPLSDADARRLVESAAGEEELGAAAASRIVGTAEGNPLFLEQLVAVGSDAGEVLPSSIQAVLGARLDRLAPGERTVLREASVQGRSFYVGAVEELLPAEERGTVADDVVSLARKQLIRADRSEIVGKDAFRFAHALIREAAYDGLPKQRRAELHEGLSRWLEARLPAREEAIGHHLAEAYRNRAALGPVGARERALANGAAERLGAAARGALVRGDLHAAAHLLERAVALLAPDDPARATLLPELAAALLGAGRLADADRMLAEAIEAASDDPRLESRARVERELVRLQAGTGGPTDGALRVAESALAVLEAHGDELGLCRAWSLAAEHSLIEGRVARADEAWRRAAEHARRAGDEPALYEVLTWRAAAGVFGPTPVAEAIDVCRELHEQVRGSPIARASVLHALASLHAMGGDLDEARRLLDAGDEILGELGGLHAAVSQQEALVEMLAGRPEAAEQRLRTSYEQLKTMGEKALLATTAAMLAQLVYAQGDRDAAAELCRVSEGAAAANDLSAQVTWRGVSAKLLAERGSAAEAEALAHEAVRLAEPTDFLAIHAEALLDLATVLRRAGKACEADQSIRAALALYEQKGDVVSAARARSQLTPRRQPSTSPDAPTR